MKPISNIRIAELFAFLVCVTLSQCVYAQTLSSNSGINANDTYTVFDVAIQTSGTENLSQAVYPAGSTTATTSPQVSSGNLSYHVEAGYDTNGGLVVNMWPTGAALDSTKNVVDPS